MTQRVTILFGIMLLAGCTTRQYTDRAASIEWLGEVPDTPAGQAFVALIETIAPGTENERLGDFVSARFSPAALQVMGADLRRAYLEEFLEAKGRLRKVWVTPSSDVHLNALIQAEDGLWYRFVLLADGETERIHFFEWSQSPAEIGKRAPLLGQAVDWLQGDPSEEFRSGRIYLLDFWATWCAPCLKAMPKLNELARQYADRLEVIGVATKPRGEMIPTSEFLAQGKIEFTVAEDRDNRMAEAYGASNLPTVVLIDGNGRVAWRWIGSDAPVEEVLRRFFDGDYTIPESLLTP